jgi:hypothetical protein
MRTNELLAMPSKQSNCLQTRLQIVKTVSPFQEKRETRGLGLVCKLRGEESSFLTDFHVSSQNLHGYALAQFDSCVIIRL